MTDLSGHWLPPRRVRQRFTRASRTYDAAAQVADELRDRLLERLDLVRLQPQVVLDLGAGTGKGTRALRRRYPDARVLALDSSAGMTEQARRRRGWLRRFDVVHADATALPLASRSVDLVLSHLMLPWCNEPDDVFAECARVLRPGGLLMFTTLGPDTARELRGAFGSQAPTVHVHAHIDMHDIGDALMRARFADPVMDVEQLTVTYPTVDQLLAELRASGATNVALGAARGLSSRQWLEQARNAYEQRREGGRLPFTIEAVYGHAWCVEATRQRHPGEIAIPLSRIGRRG